MNTQNNHSSANVTHRNVESVVIIYIFICPNKFLILSSSHFLSNYFCTSVRAYIVTLRENYLFTKFDCGLSHLFLGTHH